MKTISKIVQKCLFQRPGDKKGNKIIGSLIAVWSALTGSVLWFQVLT